MADKQISEKIDTSADEEAPAAAVDDPAYRIEMNDPHVAGAEAVAKALAG